MKVNNILPGHQVSWQHAESCTVYPEGSDKRDDGKTAVLWNLSETQSVHPLYAQWRTKNQEKRTDVIMKTISQLPVLTELGKLE